MAAISQSLLEEYEGAGSCVSGDGIARKAKVDGISPQKTVELSSHEITETLNNRDIDCPN